MLGAGIGLTERSLKKLFHLETPQFSSTGQVSQRKLPISSQKQKRKQTAVRNLGVKLEMRVDFWGPPLNTQMGFFLVPLCSVQSSHLQLGISSLGEGAEKVLREECIFCASAGWQWSAGGDTQTAVQDLGIKLHLQKTFQESYCFQCFFHTHFQSYIALSIPAPCRFPSVHIAQVC